MKLHLRPTKKVLLALGGITLLCVSLAAMAFHKLGQLHDQCQAALNAKQREAQEMEAAAKQLPESEQQLADIRFRLSMLQNVAASDYQPALLLDMTQLVQRSGLRLTMFDPADETPTKQSPLMEKMGSNIAPHQYLPVTVGVEGSFYDLSRFLYRLTGLPKIVTVDTMQIAPLSEGRATDVRATLQVTAYHVKDMPPETMTAVEWLRKIYAAETAYQTQFQRFGDLNALSDKDLLPLKEGEIRQQYLFTTDAATTGSSSFKILAKAQKAGLHDLSIDQSQKITDETDKAPFE